MTNMSENNYIYLDKINGPEDLRALPKSAMPTLAEEIRRELILRVSENGGHLASNLGAVEMSIAIHRVFNSPHDHIIFDVGHQSYVHKMLTGRRDKMDTLRQAGGISGFTNRGESEHDCFGAGHSSTSLSAALGFAISDKLCGSDAYTVAVVGDGAYTGGMIHEALNNCRKDIRLIIILNENEMSISKNIGRFALNLARIRTKSGYFKTKKATGQFLKHIPLIGKWLFEVVLGIKKMIKNTLYGSNYFESMGLTYLGPIDGNDYDEMESLLREAVKLNESVVLHIKTTKGKGYQPAETAPDRYHGMSPAAAQKADKPNFSHVMGNKLAEMAREDSRVCAITAAMCDGTGLEKFKENFHDRFFDVGIAEDHAVTFASALAANKMKPYFAVYSSFLQRAYDNIIHDAALQSLPIKLCIDRAGLNESDGATHHGIFDVAFLSQIPRMTIFTPITDRALERALEEADKLDSPCAIRYPNAVEDSAVISEFYSENTDLPLGAVKNYSDTDKPDAVIVTYGNIVKEALSAREALAAQGVSVGIILLEMLKPYDRTAELIENMLPAGECTVLFLEEGIKNGGAGMILADTMKDRAVMKNKRVKILAIDDSFVDKRAVGERIYDSAHIGEKDIIDAITKL